jgi:hypothetical protein
MIIFDFTENRALRIFECISALSLWITSLYYLQLIDAIAPLVQTIFLIFRGIGDFMVLLTIAGVAFACAFHLIGLNQIEFDEIPAGSSPLYSDFTGSL